MTRTYPQTIAQNHSIFFYVPFAARINANFRRKFCPYGGAARETRLAPIEFWIHGKHREMVFVFHATHRY
jgi:hypothetical protein